MATSNRDRVRTALDLVKEGLAPYVEREMARQYGPSWGQQSQGGLPGWSARSTQGDFNAPSLDTSALLGLVADHWTDVFASKLGPSERNLVHEMRRWRNKWAHEEPFSTDDTYRVLDDATRLLSAVSAADEVRRLEDEKHELLRARYEEQTRRETRKAAVAATEGQPTGGLKPWRDVITPHPDVASGRYQQAEFAADLAQVHEGRADAAYGQSKDFFQRTFLTDGLRHLLVNALLRLDGNTGDPVVKLQTNFGGGKTHSMLALYHLVRAAGLDDLPGLEPVFQEAHCERPPSAQLAVLVGTALGPAKPRPVAGGIELRTLWGEMAWQLGGEDGYSLVAEADRAGVSPGSNTLVELFSLCSPCLVLVDEWVAYVRQLYGVSGLPAGSFEANLTFAQALTEAAKAAPRTLVVASIPSSDIEVGGEAGREALKLLENTFARVESAWRPASAEEGFEIVRRRLFSQVADPVARDAVVRAFSDLYRAQSGDFPPRCREADYARRLTAAYPIHPELFDQLYGTWSTLERFQRTRGVLRLMATVIHALWERQDHSLLILPATLPIDDIFVRQELTRYLDDGWQAVIERDVDGPSSLPLTLDGGNPNFGRYSAVRRVARTVYLGSAPVQGLANKGVDDRQVKLGSTQPGESVATFGDALRQLSDQATYLYVDKGRYWYALQPSVARLAQDRADQLHPHAVDDEILRRLRATETLRDRGDFVRVHACPATSADVPDEPETRLVVLGPDHPHAARDQGSPAQAAAAEILDHRGSAPRTCRNALLFLAPDRNRLAELRQGVRQYLAWKSIHDESVTLNLDAHQASQATSKTESTEDAVKRRIPETYCWLLVPVQTNPLAPVTWEDMRLQGDDPLVARASRRARSEEMLVTQYGSSNLRGDLNHIPLWPDGQSYVLVKQLCGYYAQYPYLQRLRDPSVLLETIRDGVARLTWETETFAYAEGWDEAQARYPGLRAGATGSVTMEGGTLVVKSEAAARQRAAENATQRAKDEQAGASPISETSTDAGRNVHDGKRDYGEGLDSTTPTAIRYRRFHGAVHLNPRRAIPDADQVIREVLQHFTSLVDADVEVTLEIQARVPGGAPDDVVHTVTENCRTLKFDAAEFEEE